MARYIDADSIYSRVKRHTNPYGKPTLDYESGLAVMRMIEQEPAADVVPRSELAVTSFRDAATIFNLQEANKKRKVELAEEIIKDFLNCVPKRLEGHNQDAEIGYLLAVNEMLAALQKLNIKYHTE